jgi:hypothetical protein
MERDPGVPARCSERIATRCQTLRRAAFDAGRPKVLLLLLRCDVPGPVVRTVWLADACSVGDGQGYRGHAAPAPGSRKPQPPPSEAHGAHRRGLEAHTAGRNLLPAGVARIQRQALLMYELIIPGLLPFILLGTVMGLSWWEDHLLPPARSSVPSESLAEPLPVPVVPVPDPQPTSDPRLLTPDRAAR